MSDPQENIIGIHAVAELLKQSPESVISLVFQSGRDDPRLAELRALAQQHNIESEDMDKRSMDKKFDGVHQGAVAISRA
ncbi:MAG: 23S rRNA (guanosine(2251)-2'-O)-methyltransferase RlmB, partial [Gammaproteobacteria bacterium]|nr:23S rRNA (guanosine(2251)-2'-O)-methyltransferase RlmB [Gammaproteobacteria bacterium]